MNTPTKPIMGSVDETYPGSNVYYLSFGGVPKSDWSGRDSASNSPVTDLCYRPIDPVAGQKGSVYRSKGLDNKLKKGSKLSDFQREVTDHLVRYGLDTISYLPDPKEGNKVRCVVTHHARYTSDILKAVKSSKDIQDKFDSWDKKHDYEAKLFFDGFFGTRSEGIVFGYVIWSQRIVCSNMVEISALFDHYFVQVLWYSEGRNSQSPSSTISWTRHRTVISRVYHQGWRTWQRCHSYREDFQSQEESW